MSNESILVFMVAYMVIGLISCASFNEHSEGEDSRMNLFVAILWPVALSSVLWVGGAKFFKYIKEK